jgi:hypothetical protein
VALKTNFRIIAKHLEGKPINKDGEDVWAEVFAWLNVALAPHGLRRSEVCGGIGILQFATGECECYGGILGVGPTCEYSDAETCHGNGSAQPTGSCKCDDYSVGVHCEFSDAATCSNAGKVQSTGECVCDTGSTGSDCSKTVTALMVGLFFAAGMLWVFSYCLDCCGARAYCAQRRTAVKLRQKEIVFARSHPLAIKTLAGDTFTLADWGKTENLHKALIERYPAELGECDPHALELRAISDCTWIDPTYGGPGRQRLLSGEVGCNELVLTFAPAPTDADQRSTLPPRQQSVYV